MAERFPGVKFVIEAATVVHVFRQSALFFCHFFMYQLWSSELSVVSKPIMNNRCYFAFSSNTSSGSSSIVEAVVVSADVVVMVVVVVRLERYTWSSGTFQDH
jgi:hypothetical protein